MSSKVAEPNHSQTSRNTPQTEDTKPLVEKQNKLQNSNSPILKPDTRLELYFSLIIISFTGLFFLLVYIYTRPSKFVEIGPENKCDNLIYYSLTMIYISFPFKILDVTLNFIYSYKHNIILRYAIEICKIFELVFTIYIVFKLQIAYSASINCGTLSTIILIYLIFCYLWILSVPCMCCVAVCTGGILFGILAGASIGNSVLNDREMDQIENQNKDSNNPQNQNNHKTKN